MSRPISARLILAATASVCIAASAAHAQGNPPSAISRVGVFVVDGERLPALPGLMDSLRLGRFTVDSSVAPARRRVVAENAPGGAVFFPADENIKEIEVLKGPRAALFYGDDAASGVIIVTSKRPSVPKPGRTRDASG